MAETNTRQIVEVILSREELALILTLIRADTIPGLEADPLGELTSEQRNLGLIFAERALRARELARLGANGQLLVQNALLNMVGACAFAQTSVLVQHHFPDQHPPAQYFGHIREGILVAHTLPDQALHRLALVPDRTALIEQIISVCQASNLPRTAAVEMRVSRAALAQVREAAAQNQAAGAAILVQQGAVVESARLFAQALAAPHHLSVIQIIQIHPQDQMHLWDLTLVHSDQTAWLAYPLPLSSDGNDLYLVRSIHTSELIRLLNSWI